MTRNEPSFNSEKIEKPTFGRFSLVNDLIVNDTVVRHIAGIHRVIECQTPKNELQRSIRRQLVSDKLILGRMLEKTDNAGIDAFVLPTSARPLAYETSVKSEGEYSYGDKSLFRDLGHLLGSLNNLEPEGILLPEGIEHFVAIVDFRKPEDGRFGVMFTPGVEQAMVVAPEISHAHFYTDYLLEKLGPRFHDMAQEAFIDGYLETTASEPEN